MTAITRLKTAQNIQFFDHAVALNLVQAFHRQLELEGLLQLFYSQASAVLQTAGMRYRNDGENVDWQRDQQRGHAASYNLTYQNEQFGELTFYFVTPVSEDVLATAEDLVALAMSPLRNALLYRRALLGHPRPGTGGTAAPAIRAPEPGAMRASDSGLQAGRDDALILVRIDDIEEIRQRDGDAWAQTLVQAVQNQIDEGLREADGVFQIGDGQLAVLLPNTSGEAAAEVAVKLRVLIAGLHLASGDVDRQLTACMGVAGTAGAASAESVLDQAREALAQARREGPNSIRRYDSA